jgi:hypothetical protein
MASLRASLASLRLLRSSASVACFVLDPALSGSLQAGQRLAKPGLSGFSSNSSEQTAQIRIGNAIGILCYQPACSGGAFAARDIPFFPSATKLIEDQGLSLITADPLFTPWLNR